MARAICCTTASATTPSKPPPSGTAPRARPACDLQSPRMALLPPDTSELVLRLLAASVIGSGIGIDREVRGKPAGMRTHALVSLGAALCTVVVVRVAPPNYEHVDAISRAIQGTIAGAGFLARGPSLQPPPAPPPGASRRSAAPAARGSGSRLSSPSPSRFLSSSAAWRRRRSCGEFL